MLITKEYLENNGIDLKAWVSAMQREGRSASSRAFLIIGPATFPVRPRRSGAAPSHEVNHSFIGGERFRIGSVVVERAAVGNAWMIKLVLTPVDMALAGAIASASMTLEHAQEVFEGLSGWVHEMSKATSPEPARVKKPHSLEEQRVMANPAWGAWGA